MHAPNWRLGCVSYLNTRPLVHQIENYLPGVELIEAVPAALAEMLESDRVDVALCPAIDYQRSKSQWKLLPATVIACNGPTLTVRAYARIPFEHVNHVAVDTESHTSVALLRIILQRQFGRTITLHPLNRSQPDEPAIMLIGDKVVTDPPDPQVYRYELDLGAQWKQLTDLQFVFAGWMAKATCVAQRDDWDVLAMALRQCALDNLRELSPLIDRYARAYGWPEDQARLYLGQLLRYPFNDRKMQSLQRFYSEAAAMRIIPHRRELRMIPISA